MYNYVMENKTTLNFTQEQLNEMPKEAMIGVILQLQESIIELSRNYDNLIEQIRIMNQRAYGRKTESASNIDELQIQLELAFNEAEVTKDEKVEEPSLEEIVEKKTRKKKGQKEENLKKILRQREEFIEISDEELDKRFGVGKWKRLPYQDIKKLEHIPACFEAVTYHIGVYAANDNQTIIRAPKPVELIEKSICTPSLLSSIIVAKYVNAVPLYRQEKMYEANDVPIKRASMANWVIYVSDRYFSYLYNRFKKELLRYPLVHTDESPFGVTKDGRPAGSKSYMWVYRTNPQISDKQIVLYNYCPTRGGENVHDFMPDYKGILETDAFSGYHALEDKYPDQYKIAGCWVHALRKFKEEIKANGKKHQNYLAADAVRKIQKIFQKDHEITQKELSLEEIKEERQKVIKPLVDEFFEWAKEKRRIVDPESANGKALAYVINQEKYLRVFLDEPIVPLDNNKALSEEYTYPNLFLNTSSQWAFFIKRFG